MRPGAGHDLNDHDGLPDGSGVAVSHSLRLGGYLLNHGRRWHAFLINVQVRNAKTASGTTVAIAHVNPARVASHGSLAELQEATCVVWVVFLIGELGPAVRALPAAAGKVGDLISGSVFC